MNQQALPNACAKPIYIFSVRPILPHKGGCPLIMSNEWLESDSIDASFDIHEGDGLTVEMDAQLFMEKFCDSTSLLVRMTDRTIVASSKSLDADTLKAAYKVKFHVHDMGLFMNWPVPSEQKNLFSEGGPFSGSRRNNHIASR